MVAFYIAIRYYAIHSTKLKPFNMKQETKYNKIVNIAEDGEITVLDYTFIHSDSFKGATGTTFRPITMAEYDERTEEEYVIDYLMDSGMDLPKEHARGGWQSVYEAMYNNDEIESFMFDTSYSELWDYLRETTGLSEKDAYIFECTGGGRCFDKDYQGNTNPELSTIIREFES